MARRGATIEIHGAVQGVGFRPFVYRLAAEIGLDGWVRNDARGVFIEVDGSAADIDSFVDRLRSELPDIAAIEEFELAWSEPRGHDGFAIMHSESSAGATALILPDLATCDACMADVRDHTNRRHRYPFTNCTNCGPRYSIIRSLPYDRPNTTMVSFTMCGECHVEYGEPTDRRFHAQPIACPSCGPTVEWIAGGDRVLGVGSIEAAATAVRSGAIVAIKGLGGYQLVVDATDVEAVARLRTRKQRPTKPFAVMVADAAGAADAIELDDDALAALGSPAAPIVISDRRIDAPITRGVAPGNPTLGVMLPTTPLHHLLLEAVGRPVVATSGNLTDEPICIDDREAMQRLGVIADGFLRHDRPIQRHVDDSVVRRIDGSMRSLRRARGYAPLPIALTRVTRPILAVGAHLKNTVAVTVGRNAFVSQHIGDLATEEADRAFRSAIDDLTAMYDVEPSIVAHDLHPGYRSTEYAVDPTRWKDAIRLGVQHHHAHLASCLADNEFEGPALGVTWDGTGFGPDGTIWGGEFLLGDAKAFDRVGHLAAFGLPGGEAAVREPRRVAASLLSAAGVSLESVTPGTGSFTDTELGIVTTMLDRGFNTPTTTSAGRLFDGVAAILGLTDINTFEGEAAIALEHVAAPTGDTYPVEIRSNVAQVVDWRPMITAILADVAAGVSAEVVSGRFHATLAEAIVRVAERVGHPTVALTGGCFQNRLLTESAANRLRGRGFVVLLHRRVPANDGGISLGQIAVAAAQ